jgi:hypothetical protein
VPPSPPELEHTLFEQFCPLGQDRPHDPQFELLLVVLIHMLLQLPRPVAQQRALSQVPPVHRMPHPPQLPVSEDVSEHTPLQQESPLGQALPHVPQFFGSLLRLEHAPPQTVRPEPHPWHTPLRQGWPVAHLLPQEPQLLVSVWRFLQELPEQRVSPLPQLQLLPPLLQHAAFWQVLLHV